MSVPRAKIKKAKVIELDFSTPELNNPKSHPMINTKDMYIALIDGEYYKGRFSKVWFGYNFDSGWGNCGHQYDPPMTNGCNWQKVWLVESSQGLKSAESILLATGLDPVKIAKKDELRYAKAKKKYAIDHGCVSGRHKITEDWPIEHFLYFENAKTYCPPTSDLDYEDENY